MIGADSDEDWSSLSEDEDEVAERRVQAAAKIQSIQRGRASRAKTDHIKKLRAVKVPDEFFDTLGVLFNVIDSDGDQELTVTGMLSPVCASPCVPSGYHRGCLRAVCCLLCAVCCGCLLWLSAVSVIEM